MHRRTFISRIALAGAGFALAGSGRAQAAQLSRFKLGITTDEVNQDLEAALGFVREFGLKLVEIRNAWGRYITDMPLEDIRRVKQLLDRYGIRLSVMDTAIFKCTLPGTRPVGNRKDDYPYEEQQALLRRAIERSEILATRYLRIFSFWRVENPESARPRVIQELSKAVETARAADRVLLIENVGGGVAETTAEAAELLRDVPSPCLGLAWDPNNAYCGGETPFPDGYRQIDKKRLMHVHLRDAKRDPATGRCNWLPIGKGDIDNLGLLRALLKDGYEGTLTLETHYQRPDKNKELASRESLQGLLETIAKV